MKVSSESLPVAGAARRTVGFRAIRAALSRSWPEVAALLGLLASAIVLRNVAVGHDAVWQLWVARQLAHGARLYVDILEVNPPLWFWMAIPLVQLSDLVGIAPRELLRDFFLVTLTSCLLMVGAIHHGASSTARLAQYVAILIAATIVVLPDFGQREHYVLLATLPYVSLIAARAQRWKAPIGLSVTVGIFAASGLALKAHFVLVPLALEAWLAMKLRRQWTPMRPESIALAACAAAYLCCVLLFSPDYARTQLPFLFLSYADFGSAPSGFVWSQTVVLLVLTASAGLLAYRGPITAMGGATLVAALAFLLAYIAQYKGWRYHAFPAIGMLLVLAGAESTALSWKYSRHRPGALALASVALIASLEALHVGPYRNDRYAMTEAALSGLARGETVMVLAVGPATIWPMIEDFGLVWPARYMSLWMLPAIVRARMAHETSPELERLATTVRRQILEDLQCRPPKRILIDNAVVSEGVLEPQFGYLPFLEAEPELDKFLQRYRAGPRFDQLSTLDLADSDGLEPGRQCRKIF